jgi:hypothetical protein
MRSGSVSMPCRISQAVCGLMQAPKSRRPFAAGAQQEGAVGAFFAEHHAVEAGVGLVQFGKRPERPVEGPLSTSTPPTTVPWPAQELGGRVEDQVGAVVEGLHQPGRGEGAVHQQRQAGLVRDGAHGGDVQHVQARVAQRFAEQQPRLGPDGGAPAVDVAGLDEGGVMPKRASV